MASPVETVLGAAESALGVQYQWGGNSLATGVDCSGLVQQAFLAAGIALPRVSASQLRVGQPVASMDEAQPGDLIGYQNGDRNGSGVEHVALYLGNGQMIEAYATGKPVRVTAVRPGGTFRRVLGNIDPTREPAVALGPNKDRTYTTAAVSGTAAPVAAASADSTPPGGGLGDDLPADATEEQTQAYIRERLPQYAAWLDNDEIRYVLTWAVREHKGDAEIQGALEKTNYFQTHGAESRAFDTLLATDHASAVQAIDRGKATIGDLFSRNGVTLDDKTLGDLAKQGIRDGSLSINGQVSDTASLQRMLAFGLGASHQPLAGDAGAQSDTLGAIARAYLVPMTPQALEDWTRRITAGSATQDSFKAYIVGLARGQYGNDKDVLAAINDGQSVASYFEPHRQTIAGLLELSPDQIDLNDPKYREITQFYDPKTGTRRSMTLGEAAQWARNQQGYTGTRAAQEKRASLAENLTQYAGVAA